MALGADGALALPALGTALVGHWWPLLGRFPGGVGLATLVGGTVAAAGLVALPALAFGLAMVGVLRNTGNGAGFGFAMYVALGLFAGAGGDLGIFPEPSQDIRDKTRARVSHGTPP